jgi:TolA-binding protein
MSHDECVRSAMTADDRLDDIKRAQLWTRIDARLAAPLARRSWWPAVALASAAACAAVAWLVLRGHDAVALVAPADTTLSAHLGPYTRASLVGPARAELIGTPGDATAVRLRSGTLLADFTGGPGRSLRVEAPGVVVEIVGTLFAVEARADDTCVSVSHGRVRVTPRDQAALAVSAGETWCRSHAAAPITPSISDALARHAAILTAAAPPPPIVEPLPPPPPIVEPAAPPPIVEPPPPPPPGPRIVPRVAHEPVHVEAPPPPIADEPAAPSPSPSPSPPPSPSPSPPPPPPPSPPPSPSPAPAPPTADSLYSSAESSLAQGSFSAADHALAQLLASFPDSSLADQALYERARIAYQRHAYSEARGHLGQLAQLTSSPLVEPGAYLSCRIAVETHDSAAESCLLAYRKAYPRSPHDLDVLGLLVELAYTANQCAGAAPLVGELTHRYPSSSLARAWKARCK